jgi:hypothetical protein
LQKTEIASYNLKAQTQKENKELKMSTDFNNVFIPFGSGTDSFLYRASKIVLISKRYDKKEERLVYEVFLPCYGVKYISEDMYYQAKDILLSKLHVLFHILQGEGSTQQEMVINHALVNQVPLTSPEARDGQSPVYYRLTIGAGGFNPTFLLDIPQYLQLLKILEVDIVGM